MTFRRVVITGLGVIAANGTGKSEFCSALREGRSGVRFVPSMREAGMACNVAGVPCAFDAFVAKFFENDELARFDRATAYAAAAAMECWIDAGLTLPDPNSTADWDTGVICGTGIPGIQSITDFLVPHVQQRTIRRLGSTAPQRCMASGASAAIAGLLALGGPTYTVSAACASGTQAIAFGRTAIANGECDRILAGGADAESIHAWAGFDAMRVLSRAHNEEPTAASRPLSSSASGFVPSAGAAFLLLEDYATAVARGARIYAEVSGAVTNAGGHRSGGSMTAANPEGIRRCIDRALTVAGLQGKDLDLINGHLSGTAGDVIEMLTWRDALGGDPRNLPRIQATKSLTGHALGAAGAIESVASVLQISEGFVHPSINCADLHPELAWCADKISARTELLPIRHVAKASFGFGDVNAIAIFSALSST